MSQEAERLQEILARVQRNAALPRFAAAPATAYVAPEPAPVYAPPPPAFLAEAPVFDPAPFEAPPHSEPITQAAPLDASVDDLLLEDPFPSVAAPPPPSYSDVLAEDPIPLVSLSSPRSADDEDVSGVMVISELTEEQPEELLEDDIVEMTSGDGAEDLVAAQNQIDELNFDDDELDRAPRERIEEPPASSSRSRIAGTMDEALARAADQIEHDDGREVPLKTPPPESGPQEAMALPVGIHAPLSPDIEELLEADILPKGGVNAALPTQEQLGQTIDLEEARGPSLELDHPPVFVPEPLQEELPNEELEVTLPQREFGGGYQDNLMPPPEARQEMDAHLQRFGEDSVLPTPPESLAQFPSQQQPEAPSQDFAPVIVPTTVTTDSYSESVSTVTVEAPASAEFAPELLNRPDLSPSPIAKFIRVDAPRPNTFLEMLDASLSLGRDHY